ncbi:acyltransferase [Hallella colorans]|uniref:acyltransferase n=1 Tax=Hallella colorans TaxID=1703337 RepID=UPI0023F39E35|nr:acyltransferase [Hallella colorans]
MDIRLKEFDAIRPFEPEELPAVYDRLLANKQFLTVLNHIYPNVPIEIIAMKMRECKTNLEFQKAFCYKFIKDLLKKLSTGYDMDCSALDIKKNYTFMSNHRDIVLDSAILDVLLIDAGFDTTCEIAIGDNLLGLPWVKDLARLNKSFIVRRGLPLREMLLASKLLSRYMHFAIAEKHENIWIAQRPGRAKDSDDRTSISVLKMMTMGAKGSVIELLRELNVVPLTISYEFDPCDYLKAIELQQRRDNEQWKKGDTDDIFSMQTGIMGFKGRIHYHCAPCINDFLNTIPADSPKDEVLKLVADHLDHEIHRNYKLFPANYVALDKLRGDDKYKSLYTIEDKAFFDNYLDSQLAKVQMEHADKDFLREQMLTMYANPAINYLAAKQ